MIERYAQICSERMPKSRNVAFMSPGGFRDNVKYAYLRYRQKYSGGYWLTTSEYERNLLSAKDLPVLFYRPDMPPSAWDLLFRTPVVVHCTHRHKAPIALNAALAGSSVFNIQLWHGPLPKVVGYQDAVRDNNALSQTSEDFLNFAADCLSYDSIVSESAKLSSVYRSAFPNVQEKSVLPLGSSRAAALLEGFPPLYDIGLSAFTDFRSVAPVLFCPTYRESNQDVSSYLPATLELITSVATVMPFAVKLHPHTNTTVALAVQKTCRETGAMFIQGSDDIMPYLSVARALVTDYSSVVNDFMLTRRPVVFFTPDKKENAATRDYAKVDMSFAPTAVTGEQVAKELTRLLSVDNVATEEYERHLLFAHESTLKPGVADRICNYVYDVCRDRSL